MTENLRVAMVQTALHPLDPGANRAMLEEKVFGLSGQADVIVLPEMFTTGFAMTATAHAEPPKLHTHKWMAQMAAQTGAVVTGSYVVKDGGVRNRLVWMRPDGEFSCYDKKHRFRMSGEHEHFTPGSERLVVEWKGWRVCPMICYDLRFPVWSRNVGLGYDLLLYVANWPEPRERAWSTLLRARAVENLSYCVGLNGCGPGPAGVDSAGHSAAVDPKGNDLAAFGSEEEIRVVELDGAELRRYREKFPAHLDADDFSLSGKTARELLETR